MRSLDRIREVSLYHNNMVVSKKNIILFTVCVDVLGLGIVIPVLPFYVQELGGSDLVVTLLFSVFALCSFVSAPVLGVLSDRYGRRPILIGSIVSTAIGWFVFAGAPSMIFLFLGRIIDGLAAGNISTAQSYLSDLARNNKERTANLGLIGMIFGIGFIIGPTLGGMLGALGHSVPFWFVGSLATLNALLAFRFLPETHTPQPIRFSFRVLDPFAPLIRAGRMVGLRGLYVAWFFFTLAFASQQAIFTLYISRIFGFNEITAGFLLGVIGVVLALNQGIFLKRFWIERFREADLIWTMFLVLGVGFFLMSASVLWVFILGMIVGAIAQSILRVVLTSTVAGFNENRGENLGTLNSIMSLGLVVGPAFAGVVFVAHPVLPFVLSGIFALIGFCTVWFIRRRVPNLQAVPKLPSDVPIEY